MNNHEEREAFEKLPDINAILHNSEFGFNEGINQYYHPNHAEHRLSYAFLMGAWLAWQARAKAQAVPEGFVLMPKEPTDEIIEAMNEFDYRNDYSDMDGAYRTIVETLEKAQEDAEREQKG